MLHSRARSYVGGTDRQLPHFSFGSAAVGSSSQGFVAGTALPPAPPSPAAKPPGGLPPVPPLSGGMPEAPPLPPGAMSFQEPPAPPPPPATARGMPVAASTIALEPPPPPESDSAPGSLSPGPPGSQPVPGFTLSPEPRRTPATAVQVSPAGRQPPRRPRRRPAVVAARAGASDQDHRQRAHALRHRHLVRRVGLGQQAESTGDARGEILAASGAGGPSRRGGHAGARAERDQRCQQRRDRNPRGTQTMIGWGAGGDECLRGQWMPRVSSSQSKITWLRRCGAIGASWYSAPSAIVNVTSFLGERSSESRRVACPG